MSNHEATESTILNEIAAAIRAVDTTAGKAAAATMKEIAAVIGVSVKTARLRVEPLVESGAMEPVHVQRVSKMYPGGRVYTTVGYKLVDVPAGTEV